MEHATMAAALVLQGREANQVRNLSNEFGKGWTSEFRDKYEWELYHPGASLSYFFDVEGTIRRMHEPEPPTPKWYRRRVLSEMPTAVLAMYYADIEARGLHKAV